MDIISPPAAPLKAFKDPEAAWVWSHGTDQRNADVIAATKARADRVVRL